MKLPRKIKKRLTPKRIPQRLRYLPASFYEFILKQNGQPYCSAYIARQSERRLLDVMIKWPNL